MGAVDRTVVIKAVDGHRQFVLGVAYAPMEIDGHGEACSDEEIETAAWLYLADHGEIGIEHTDGTVGRFTLVESYIYRGPDWTVIGVDGDEQTVTTGMWLLGAIADAVGWRMVQSGMINGWSMQGSAVRRQATPEEKTHLVKSSEALKRTRKSR